MTANLFQPGDQLIAVVNRSTVYPDSKLPAIVKAMQDFISGVVAPIWGVNAGLVAVSTTEQPPLGKGFGQLVLLDDPDQAGVLGYHEETSEGMPLGKWFVGLDAKLGAPEGLTGLHECGEQNVNPTTNRFARSSDGYFYIVEICDPGACWWYKIGEHEDGKPIFAPYIVTPSWFDPNGQPPYAWPPPADQVITKPFMVAPGLIPNSGTGGYISRIRPDDTWEHIAGENAPPEVATPSAYGRRALHMLPRDQWRKSER